MRLPRSIVALAALAALGLALPARAADENYELTIKDHKFLPDTLEIPAGQRVKLTVKNLDPTPEEFDSAKLHREKVIPGGGVGVVNIGPLKPGTYEFVGEYHEATAKGRIVVK